MSATFVLKRSDGSEDSITIVYNETPESFAGKVGSFEDVISIDIEFDNTGRFIPAFIYSEEELEQLNNVPVPSPALTEGEIVDDGPIIVIPSFPRTRKYFSNMLKSELGKFTNLSEVNIISGGVEEDDSFPDTYTVNIKNDILSKSAPRLVPTNISTPAELYALMTSTDPSDMSQSYTVMNDIDMTGYTCLSIGTASVNFQGTFNGQGYTIKIADTSSTAFGGLFGIVVTSSSITDINIVYTANSSGNVIATFNGVTSGAGTAFTGGLIGIVITSATITNCNITYEGNVSMTGTRLGGFIGAGNNASIVTATNCNITFNGNCTFTASTGTSRAGGFIGESRGGSFISCGVTASGNFTATGMQLAGGFGGIISGTSSPLTIMNITDCFLNAQNITINATLAGGGCIGQFQTNGNISNLNVQVKDITISNFGAGGSLIGNSAGNSIINGITANIKGNVNIQSTNNGIVGTIGNIGGGIGITINITNIYAVYLDTVYFKGRYIGGLIGYTSNIGTPTPAPASISNINATFNKQATFEGFGTTSPYIGGAVAINYSNANVNTSSVFYGSNVIFTGDYIGGVGGGIGSISSFTKVVATYNSYTFTGTTVDDIVADVGGTVTDCFSNTFSSDTSVIPDTNTTNIITQLNSVVNTEWLSSLLNIRQSLDTGNNSQYLSDIFSDSPLVSNTAKNNALTAGMTFATVPYIITTSSVIEPLLVKYQNPLPTTIRYAAQNSVDEIDISELAAYYIYQNPAYIVPANKTIESSTAGDGSVVFDTTSVAVGSNITINDAVYNVRGVGSSLLEVTAPEPEPVPAEGSNNLPIFFAVIAGVILLLVLVFSYIWGWKGWMVLPAIIGLTLAILAIVFAL